ncbi:hypothetical protein [Nostoc sp.]|uniref:hypothetical protein n=1 Tax=Nostoc sp. TaxID=1180 RepID=UPI002FF5CA7F
MPLRKILVISLVVNLCFFRLQVCEDGMITKAIAPDSPSFTLEFRMLQFKARSSEFKE